MEAYKNNTIEQYSYEEKEKIQKEDEDEDEELKLYNISKEKESIINLCNYREIQESLENLIDLTSNRDFIFYEKPPSEVITAIINIIQQDDSKDKTISILCLQFIANIWNYPIFVDECLLELVVSKCFQTESLEIAITSIKSINNLIESTTEENSESFGVDNFQLDQLIFPQKPLQTEIDISNLDFLLSFLESDSADLVISTLQLILNITRVYKSPICSRIIDNAKFISLINITETQELVILIVCSLAKDDICFDYIFSPEFISQFVQYAIDIKTPHVLFKIYSILSLFPRKFLIDFLKNENLWNSVKENLRELSQYDLRDLLSLIFSINFIYPEFLDQYNFWPYIFEISQEFTVKNKVGFADILTTYFQRTINTSSQNLSEPPLCFAVSGGFEFLCEIIQYITDPLIFIHIAECLTCLVISSPEQFAPMISQLELINTLMDTKKNISLDIKDDDEKVSKQSIMDSITDFIKTVSPFT